MDPVAAFTCPTCKQPYQSRDLHLAFNAECRAAAVHEMAAVLEFRRGIHLVASEQSAEVKPARPSPASAKTAPALAATTASIQPTPAPR
jgi:hypothetical protein